MNTQDNSEERKVFEAWAHESAIRTDLGSWEGWQASTQRQQERIAELEAQVQALSVDAGRFRFADESEEDFAICYWDSSMGNGGEWMCNGSKGNSIDLLDAAIARATHKEQT